MKYFSTLNLMLIFSILISLSSCSDSENRHLALLNQAKVIIDMGLPDKHASAGLMDKLRRLFIREAIAQTAPATFSTIKVRITGPDIGLIEKDFGAFDTITLNVKAGALRTFEVIAYVAPGDPSAAASFRGTATAALPAGATVGVFVEMNLHETKIVVPDFANSRMVVMDSINDTGTILSQYNCSGDGCSFQSYDADFDARGRLHVANYQSSNVLRFHNLNISVENTVESLGFFLSGIQSIAIDRTRNYLYCTDGSTLYQVDLNNPLPLTPFGKDITPISTIYGIDVTPGGDLYILGNDGIYDVIYKYKPGTTSEVGAVDGTPYLSSDVLISSRDIIVRPPYIYVATGTSFNPLLRIQIGDYNLDYAFPFGTLGSTQTTGVFYSPRRFLGLRNNVLIIIDDSGNLNQLISLDYPSFSGWTTAPSSIGFEFYSVP